MTETVWVILIDSIEGNCDIYLRKFFPYKQDAIKVMSKLEVEGSVEKLEENCWGDEEEMYTIVELEELSL